MAKFNRTALNTYLKLGSRQKSKRKYKKARGRHNKIRQKEKSRPVKVEIGFKNKTNERSLINNKIPVLVYNVKDLEKIKRENIAIIGKIGRRKKVEIAKEAVNKKISIYGLNAEKFVDKIKRKIEKNKKLTKDNKNVKEKNKPEEKTEEKNEKNKSDEKNRI